MTIDKQTNRRVPPTKRDFSVPFDALTKRFNAKPDSAISQFEVTSRQVSGLRSEVEARDFILTVDEPEGIGGDNLGPNPIELILAAAATCQEITYRLYADHLGIPLKSVSVTAKGDVDLKGLFSVDPSVRTGLRGIELEVEIESDATDEQINRLKRTVDAVCPVLDTVRNPTPVLTRTTRIGDPVEQDNHYEDIPVFAGLAG